MSTAFVNEAYTHRLAAEAGLRPPRHGWLGAELPFRDGEPVVLKGMAHGLWHKTELGALRAMAFDRDALALEAATMRARVEGAGYPWVGALVCERITIARSEGLPSEAFVSLTRGDAGWTLLFGLGGLQAEALAKAVPPLYWPVAWLTPEAAYDECVGHLLGQVWLGRLRGTRALTSEAQLRGLLASLWRLAELAEDAGLGLLELNPVVLDETGEARPLDGVGQPATARATMRRAPPAWLAAMLAARRVAVAGVSEKADAAGHIIVENLREAGLADGDLLIVKPGHDALLGLPCVAGVEALAMHPVDLLLVALPALAAVELLEALVAQGGGASVVGLVAGGIGDGADTGGLAARVTRLLDDARRDGRWTPAVFGPNFLGHVVPGARLNTTFIPADRWRPPARGGPLALVSQSGAFLLSRLARAPRLPLGLGLALGNGLDVGLGRVLEALVEAPELKAVAAYVEGFAPGELALTARAAATLVASGRTVVLYRAGRTEAGQVAAASHTGAMAGQLLLEEAVLRRAGVRLAPTIAAFDAALTWLGGHPELRPGPVAVVSNAGFETVSGADRLGGAFAPARLDEAEVEALAGLLARHELGGLVSARLPLDLTPMAGPEAYREAIELVLAGEAQVVVVGLVPFTRRLAGLDPLAFASGLRAAAREAHKALAFVVDAGPDGEALRAELAASGAPVFTRLEDAIVGLAVLALGA